MGLEPLNWTIQKWSFAFAYRFLIQTEPNIVLDNDVIIFLEFPMIRGCLVQYIYSVNGRIQWLEQLKSEHQGNFMLE